MYNSRTNPSRAVFHQHHSNQLSRREKPQKPHHPSKVQAMNCFTAKACGRRLPLLSITLQGYTSFRHLTFHSVHCQPPASATHARVLPFIPLRSGQPTVSFRSPLAFLSHVPELKAKSGSCIPPTPIRYITFSHHPCFSPCQPAACPAVEFAPENKNLKYPTAL